MENYSAEVPWTGKSGRNYKYFVYKIGTELSGPGNFVFTRRAANGDHDPIFFGQTKDLQQSLATQAKAGQVVEAGATHVCVHNEVNEGKRAVELSDLVTEHHPPCNAT
ncbi:MAG: hypothetical protein ABI559_09410 [Chloroflexota bacterium]